MPTLLRIGPYSLHIFSADGAEPPHVHVDRDDRTAKVWLDPVRIAYNRGFSDVELRRVARIVHDHQGPLLRGWHGYFGS